MVCGTGSGLPAYRSVAARPGATTESSPGFASQAWSLPDGTRSVVILLNETGYDDLATSAIDAALCT